MKLADFTAAQKTAALVFALVASISGGFGFMYATFETVSASEMKWDQHTQILVCRTVAQTRIRVAKLESYIKHAKPPPNEVAQAKDEIAALKEEIQILDPQRRCERA
jgi:hypothetical protein